MTSELLPDWFAGINVSMDLLDSSGRGGDLDAAYQQKIQVGHLRIQALRDLHVLVERTYKSAEQSLDEYNGLASSESLAKENIRLRELAFDQGMSTSIQVSDAQTFLQTVKTRRLSAAYQYVVNLCQLLALSGEINTFSDYQNSQGIEVQ
jgi:outer membrane protein TolC